MQNQSFVTRCVYNNFFGFAANAGKYYGTLVNYCGKAWEVHLDCVMKVGQSLLVAEFKCNNKIITKSAGWTHSADTTADRQ